MMPPDKKHTWKTAFLSYKKPRVIGMLFLGFSAGLPFLLVFSTLSAWLKDAGISRPSRLKIHLDENHGQWAVCDLQVADSA